MKIPIKVVSGLFLVVATIFPCLNFAQVKYDYNDYQGIKCEGDIPADFLTSWKVKAKARYDEMISGDEKKRQKEDIEKFWVVNHYVLADLLTNGAVSFGDPITQYLNRIKERVLKDKPELAKKIRVYTMKSPLVNAYCTAEGVIFVNVGLVARAKTEAELAFILCHEICHYTESHSLESYYERLKVLEGDVEGYEDLSAIEKINHLIRRSQNDEFDADEKGLKLFMESDYSLEGVDGTLDLLHRSYLPFEEYPLQKDFLNTAELKLPSIYFLDSVKPITKEEDYFDETHSHPNIHRRRTSLDELMKYRSYSGKGLKFIEGESVFRNAKTLAQFETVKQEVTSRRYGDAIYHIGFLRKKYPNSRFLDMSFTKALYGLACYKAINKYRRVARSYNKVEGESQQLHFVLRQFDRKQISSIALHHVLEMKKKYPNEKALDIYANELTKHMYVSCNLDAEDFSVEGIRIPPFNKPRDQFKNDRAYLRAQQKHYKDFYKYALKDEYRTNWLSENLDKHQSVVDSLEMELKLTARYKKSRKKMEERQMRKLGSGLNLDKILILDPNYKAIGIEDVEDYEKSLELEGGFKKQVLSIAKSEGVEAIPLYTEQMNSENVELYNNFSELKKAINEAQLFYLFDLKPTNIDRLLKKTQELSIRYVCLVGGVVLKREKESWYYFAIYDLKKGTIVYERTEDLNRKISKEELEEEFRKDIQRIKS